MVRRADPEMIAKCRTALDEMKNWPPGKLFADMIARGIINERGQVLYGNEKPEKAAHRKPDGSAAKKKKPTAKKPANGKSSNGKHS